MPNSNVIKELKDIKAKLNTIESEILFLTGLLSGGEYYSEQGPKGELIQRGRLSYPGLATPKGMAKAKSKR